MTEREKCAHLLRKFGLGVTETELNECEKRGLKASIEWLIDAQETSETFDLNPWSFAYDKPGEANMDTGRYSAWFALKLVTSMRPLEANMTLFWHNHFSVSGSKITFGPMMVDHVELLRSHALGNFRILLGEVSRDPAMIRWLDTDTNIKGRPNENFARELLELFTLGVGNYTEKDIQEVTRAFTGWSVRAALTETRGLTADAQLKLAIRDERPIVVFTDCPALHDRKEKKILGRSGNFEADDVLDLLVSHPAHARFLMRKLWSYFVYPDPDPKLIDRLAKVYTDAKFEMKVVLRWIANSKEFWSEKAQRSVVKSPAHYTFAFLRQLGVREILATANLNVVRDLAPVDSRIVQLARSIAQLTRRQGMTLMFPPDVAGWEWGNAWITTASVIERNRLADVLLRNGSGFPAALVSRFSARPPATPDEAVSRLIEWFDVPANDEARKIMAMAFEQNGGLAALSKAQSLSKAVSSVMRLATSLPEFQMN
ncbi:MAG: DUF1800 domain-containing protein [Fimbriimonadaceae bacterium]